MIKSITLPVKTALLLIPIILTSAASARKMVPVCNLKKPNNGIYVVAHRGAHEGIPENSLAAYQKAIELGCDFVEIDVRTTKDGKFVSIHNSKIDEYTTGHQGKVSELTLAELKSLDIGSSTGTQWKNTRIPTFGEILELCKGKIGIYLDLKAASVPLLVEIIKKYGMERDILWYISASDKKDITDLKTSCPECVLMADPGPLSNIDNVMKNFSPCVLATDMDQLSEEFVTSAHNLNAIVITDEKEGTAEGWQKIIDWKTDGIQTDRPAELIEFLKSERAK